MSLLSEHLIMLLQHMAFIESVYKKIIWFFLAKIYVLGVQSSRLDETVTLYTQNIYFN